MFYSKQILQLDPADEEAQVSYLENVSGQVYKWPTQTDEAWVSFEHIEKKLDPPILKNNRGLLTFTI